MTHKHGRLFCALAAGAAMACLVSAARADIVWHGYTQTRFYQPEGGPGRFRIDRVSLNATAQLDPKITAYVEFYFHPYVPATTAAEPGRTYLESAYTDFKIDKWLLPAGTLRVGKGRRQTFGITPAYSTRKVSNYGILSEMFTQDRAQGVQYFFVDKCGLDAGIGVTTAYRLGARGIGDINKDNRNTVLSLADRDVPQAPNENLELSARVGVARKDGIRYGVTGSYSKLDPDDLAFLNANFPGITHSSQTRERYGAYFTVPRSNYILQGELYGAKTSDIFHNAWQILAGYDPKGMKPKAYVRYAQVNMDYDALAQSQYTWDKQQLTFSYVKPIRPSIWVQMEYEHNTENPPAGTAQVKNDVGFVELFTGF